MEQIKTIRDIITPQTKWSFTSRRVKRDDVAGINYHPENAVAGDLVLCQITELGQHKKIQLAEGRYSLSYVNDQIVMVCGDRYAPDQFEGFAEVNSEGCDILAGGGIVGRMTNAHRSMSKPTNVRPIGLLTDSEGEVINIANYALPPARIPASVIVIGVFGSSMNAGKTTAAVSLAHGLKKSGFRVEGIKATGTGAFGDFNAFLDAGIPVSDFTDAGMATTYKVPLSQIERGFEALVGAAAARGAEVVVVEIADGVFQRETAEILSNSTIKDRFNAIMFAAPDALGAVGGVKVLESYGLQPFTISGMVTRSPLAINEVRETTGVSILSREQLLDPVALMPVASYFMDVPGGRYRVAA